MARLSIIIGVPGSGKTTFAKSDFFKGYEYLSSDEIRKELYGYETQEHNSEVFEVLNKRLFAFLGQNKSVVCDATNLSEKRRKNVIREAKKYAEVNAYLMCSPISTILERNMGRERKIPWDKLEEMIRSIQCPMYYEDFDNIYLVNNKMNEANYDYEDLLERCNIPQDNPYHKETLKEHIENTIQIARTKRRKVRFWIDYLILEEAAKYHDMGKLYTKTYNAEKGYFTYYNHENVSTYLYLCQISKTHSRGRNYIFRLKDSNYYIAALIQNHMKFYNGNIEKVKEKFRNDDLFRMLELLHEADEEGRES